MFTELGSQISCGGGRVGGGVVLSVRLELLKEFSWKIMQHCQVVLGSRARGLSVGGLYPVEGVDFHLELMLNKKYES